MHISSEIVFGYHGCDKIISDNVIKNGYPLGKSQNSYDWLGHGIYFWEGSYEQALDWANKNPKVNNPSVVGAIIKLCNCLDLLDTEHTKKLKVTYEILKKELDELGQNIPKNKSIDKNGFSFSRELDCRVLMRLHELNNEQIAKQLKIKKITTKSKLEIQNHIQFIDSVRGMFPEGDELYPNAGFRIENHIQLCIINPNCILGYFEPILTNKDYKKI
ncbi:MAG: hypothetical protein AABZ74_11625 [Cyanobacteriota bacterium]